MISTWLMDSTSQPISVTVSRHHSTGNQRYGYVSINGDPTNAPGAILIQESFGDQSGSYGAVGRWYSANGASLTFFQNLTVKPHVNGPARLMGTAPLSTSFAEVAARSRSAPFPQHQHCATAQTWAS